MFRTVALICAAVVSIAANSSAQDPAIFVTSVSSPVKIGDTVRIPLLLTQDADTIAGFRLDFVLSRPGLLEFNSANAPVTAGSLIAGWELVDATVFGPGAIRVVGIADDITTPEIQPPLILPGSQDALLVTLVGVIACMRDPFGDYEVRMDNTIVHEFTTQWGELITPVAVRPVTLAVQTPLLGDPDQNGLFDVRDVVNAINCAFRSNCPGCMSLLADVNCSGATDIVDVVLQIGHIFRAEAPPCMLIHGQGDRRLAESQSWTNAEWIQRCRRWTPRGSAYMSTQA